MQKVKLISTSMTATHLFKHRKREKYEKQKDNYNSFSIIPFIGFL